MHGMTSAIGDYVTQNLVPDQRQVSNQIQNFVAHKLVVETQRGIHHSIAGQHNRVLVGSSADQPLLAHGFGLMQKSECPRRSNVGNVIPVGQSLRESLAPDQRMRKVDSVRNRVVLLRIHRDELVAFAKLKGLKDPDVSSWAPLFPYPRAADQVNERPRASVENG